MQQRKTYLVVAAHPDDADFGVAGTVAKLAREGHAVHYLVCTSGDAGTEDSEQAPNELANLREAEQDAAGQILGLAGTHYLRFTDGELFPTLELRKAIVRVIRQVKPDVVLSLDPRQYVNDEGTYLNHPDHRAAGQATLDAVFPTAQNPAAFRDLIREGYAPHHVSEVWLYFTSAPHKNWWVDVTDTLELKLRALAAHTSQVGDWAENGGMQRELTRWAAAEAKRHNLGYLYAEAFQRVVLKADEEGETTAEAEALAAQTEGDAG